jgi:hypothetical protein
LSNVAKIKKIAQTVLVLLGAFAIGAGGMSLFNWLTK